MIYSFQLYRSKVNLQTHSERYNADRRSWLVLEKEVDITETPSEARKYPGYLIQFTVGGYVITFHLLLFIGFIPRLMIRHVYAFKYILDVLLPPLLLYALQYLIVLMIDSLMRSQTQAQPQVATTTQQPNVPNTSNPDTNTIQVSTDQDTPPGCFRLRFWNYLKNILEYFMLVASKTFLSGDIRNRKNKQILFVIVACFIGIVSSIIRLILILSINIVSLNRIDSASFVDPFTDLSKTSLLCNFSLL